MRMCCSLAAVVVEAVMILVRQQAAVALEATCTQPMFFFLLAVIR
jgi:hypothetical protein